MGEREVLAKLIKFQRSMGMDAFGQNENIMVSIINAELK